MPGERPGFAGLPIEAGGCPLERARRGVAPGDEGLGALEQVRGRGMAGVAKYVARVDAEEQLDLVDPAGMQRREVHDEAPAVTGIELIPHGVRAMRVQVVPDDVHGAPRVRAGDPLHERHEVALGAPLGAAGDDPPRVRIERRRQRLRAVSNVSEPAPTRVTGPRRAVCVLALDGLQDALQVTAADALDHAMRQGPLAQLVERRGGTAAIFGRLARQGQQLQPLRVDQTPWPARTRRLLQTLDPKARQALTPRRLDNRP